MPSSGRSQQILIYDFGVLDSSLHGVIGLPRVFTHGFVGKSLAGRALVPKQACNPLANYSPLRSITARPTLIHKHEFTMDSHPIHVELSLLSGPTPITGDETNGHRARLTGSSDGAF